MRDTIKTKEHFMEMFRYDSETLKKDLDEYYNHVVVGDYPESFQVQSFKHFLFIHAFYKFYTGYSLGLDIHELLPEVKLVLQNLIDTRKERDSNYEYMTMILYFILLFNQTEFLGEYKELLKKSSQRDFYLDSLMQRLDSSWRISTEKILWPREIKPFCEVIELARTDKRAAVHRLKRFLARQWFKTLKGGLVSQKDLEDGIWYRGYWCIEAAALVKALELDDTELRGCKYYPYDMAHFC